MKQLSLALSLVFLLCAFGAPATGLPEEKALDAAIRAYLLEHPEVIIESLEKYEAQARAKQERATADTLAANQDSIYNHPMTPVTGDPKGDVTIVELFDYQCGYCKRTLQTVLDLQKEDPRLRFIWKELPILGPTSEYAARAAMAANKQDKYLAFHTVVMGARGRLTPDRVLKLAAKAEIDVERLKRDMEDPAIKKYLQETVELARKLGVTGTPGFIIGGKLFPGAIDKEHMKKLIAEARATG